MRSLPTGLEQPDRNLIGPDRHTTLSFTLELITPMFGGSATAGDVDPERPVTAKSVRGQLRFRWRACHAHLYRTETEMFSDEARLFGESARQVTVNGRETMTGPGLLGVMVSCSSVQTAQMNELARKQRSHLGLRRGVCATHKGVVCVGSTGRGGGTHSKRLWFSPSGERVATASLVG